MKVLVPSFRDGMLMRLIASMEASEPGSSRLLIVLDNGISAKLKSGIPQVRFIPVPDDPFVFSQAFNIGLSAVPLGHDVVCLGDDIVITSKQWVTQCLMRFQDWPEGYGILTCAESTTASVYGKTPHPEEIIELPDVALGSGILIPWHVLVCLGLWDETLVGYGFDDFDYGVRCFHAGLKLGITGAMTVHTMEQASGWVKKLGSYDAMLARLAINADVYAMKYTGAPAPRPLVITRPQMQEHWRYQACSCR